ncbi:MAG: HAD family phosphatase [Treponema sp.]|jgi:putative hydrolase of the HAD superfamily|nr:HAD family phosphatase [Treponema sp.]
MIKAVVFDYGEVISFKPAEETGRELARIAGLQQEVLDTLRWQIRSEFDRGVLSGKEYYKKVLALAGVTASDEVAEKMARMDVEGWKRINEGTVALMKEIKNAGLILGVLSNMPHEFLGMARESLPVFKLYDVGIFSCELNFIKPEREIYLALIEKLGCKSEEIVFFDDIKVNVDGAAALGVNAYVWKDAGTARKTLLELGVLS